MLKQCRKYAVTTLLAGLIISFVVQGVAQDQQGPELRRDHPMEYVVQPGDTLWDISAKFLIRPWEWPAIWQVNPEIANPHLIFPGDVLDLSTLGNRPRLQVARRSPEPRVINDAVTAIPMQDIEGYLQFPRFYSSDELSQLPYVVNLEDRRVVASNGNRIHARHVTAEVGTKVKIAQPGYVYAYAHEEDGRQYLRRFKPEPYTGYVNRPNERREPQFWNHLSKVVGIQADIIGHELWEIAEAVVLAKQEDVATLQVLNNRQEVRVGSFVLPFDDYQYDPEFYPKAMAEIPAGEVLGMHDYAPYSGHYSIVVLDVGSRQGVAPGHVFATLRPGKMVADPVAAPRASIRRQFKSAATANVKTPDELTARLMVFRSYPELSYAIIMGGLREVAVGDTLGHPNTRF